MTIEPGTLLWKRYRITEVIGRGETNNVYHAIDEATHLEVALKENSSAGEEEGRQFRLEAVVLANLRHPHLPRVTDHFVTEDQVQCMIMEYIEGEDLQQRIERVGTLEENEAILVGAAVCDALTYLHTRKPVLVHRNIKPSTIRISLQGDIFLVGFGLVKVMHDLPGLPGVAVTDPRSDIYSLGATLYMGLSGVVPEDGLDRTRGYVRLTPLAKRNPTASSSVVKAIERAMAIDPGDRFQSAEDFRNALLGFTPSKRETDQKKFPKWVSKLIHHN